MYQLRGVPTTLIYSIWTACTAICPPCQEKKLLPNSTHTRTPVPPYFRKQQTSAGSLSEVLIRATAWCEAACAGILMNPQAVKWSILVSFCSYSLLLNKFISILCANFLIYGYFMVFLFKKEKAHEHEATKKLCYYWKHFSRAKIHNFLKNVHYPAQLKLQARAETFWNCFWSKQLYRRGKFASAIDKPESLTGKDYIGQ